MSRNMNIGSTKQTALYIVLNIMRRDREDLKHATEQWTYIFCNENKISIRKRKLIQCRMLLPALWQDVIACDKAPGCYPWIGRMMLALFSSMVLSINLACHYPRSDQILLPLTRNHDVTHRLRDWCYPYSNWWCYPLIYHAITRHQTGCCYPWHGTRMLPMD